MITRLVCRSAPLPTKHIARAMAQGCAWTTALSGCDPEPDVDLPDRRVTIFRGNVRRLTVASPADTDVGQCWSEEIFSQL